MSNLRDPHRELGAELMMMINIHSAASLLNKYFRPKPILETLLFSLFFLLLLSFAFTCLCLFLLFSFFILKTPVMDRGPKSGQGLPWNIQKKGYRDNEILLPSPLPYSRGQNKKLKKRVRKRVKAISKFSTSCLHIPSHPKALENLVIHKEKRVRENVNAGRIGQVYGTCQENKIKLAQ